MAWATQRTPTSASSASVTQPWRSMRSSYRSSCGSIESVALVWGLRPVRHAYSHRRGKPSSSRKSLPAAVMCSGARADHVHHAHRRAARRGPFHVHDLVVVTHREVHGLAGLRVKLAHHRQRSLGHVDPRLHLVPQLQQAHAEAVGAGLDAVHDTVRGHRRQDAVRSRRLQPGELGDLLRANGGARGAGRARRAASSFGR